MKKILFAFSLLLLFSIGCNDDEPTSETTTVTLHLSGLYDAENLTLNQFYDYDDSGQVAIDFVRFFVSDVRLKKGNEYIKVKDVAEFVFSSTNQLTLTLENVPVDNYTGFSFGIGLDSVLNQTIPADYELGHPLANASEYWDWRATYIFGKVEGRYKRNDNGNVIFFVYHPGTNPLYKTVNFDLNLALEKDVPKNLGLKLDTKKLFVQNGGLLDIKTNNQSHTSPEDVWLADLIITNLANALELSE